MPKRRFLCMFCLRDDAEPSSEHVWPEWLRHVFRGNKRLIERRGRAANDRPRKWNWNHRRTDALELTLSDVCHDCNQLWGATVEAKCAPFMKDMIDGWSKALSGRQQRALGLWTAKTVMTLDRLNPPSKRIVADVDPPALRRRVAPLPGMVVWMASYEGKTRPAIWGWEHKLSPALGPNVYVSTINIHHLILHLVRVNEDTEVAPTDATKGTVRQIWPSVTNPARWPPPLDHDIGGLLSLARASPDLPQ